MVRRLLALVFIGSLFLAGSGNYDTNAKIKAVYIYNFTKYIVIPQVRTTSASCFARPPDRYIHVRDRTIQPVRKVMQVKRERNPLSKWVASPF